MANITIFSPITRLTEHGYVLVSHKYTVMFTFLVNIGTETTAICNNNSAILSELVLFSAL